MSPTTQTCLAFLLGAISGFLGVLLLVYRLRQERARSQRLKVSLNEIYGAYAHIPSERWKQAEIAMVQYETEREAQGLPPFVCPCGNPLCKRGGWLRREEMEIQKRETFHFDDRSIGDKDND